MKKHLKKKTEQGIIIELCWGGVKQEEKPLTEH